MTTLQTKNILGIRWLIFDLLSNLFLQFRENGWKEHVSLQFDCTGTTPSGFRNLALTATDELGYASPVLLYSLKPNVDVTTVLDRPDHHRCLLQYLPNAEKLSLGIIKPGSRNLLKIADIGLGQSNYVKDDCSTQSCYVFDL